MLTLIVNADDFGLNAQRDRGLIEAFQCGLVTSASLIANGASFATAVAAAGDCGLPVGVHLNLSEGATLTGPIAGLTDPSGQLPGKEAMRCRLLAGRCAPTALHRELAAQIERVLASGLQPGHLDGHQHCHVYPEVVPIVIDLARQYGIDALRSARPADPDDAPIPLLLQNDLALLRRCGGAAQAAFRAAGLRTPDGLWGLPLLHSLNTESLCAVLDSLPAGDWELMTHPGYPVPHGRPFESAQRQVELQALTSAAARRVVEERGIRLCRFSDLPCVC
ncbi:MAG: ChbG/HpnK family deacetylase [Desulfuromonadales bacterium]|nr:ChbG/HpnK family deacetylase [Desulfuromonadales bacterium]